MMPTPFGEDKTDLSWLRQGAPGAPAPSATPSPDSSAPAARVSSPSPDRRSLFRVSDSDAALNVLFGRKDLRDPGGGPAFAPGATFSDRFSRGTDVQVRIPEAPGEDSPWNLVDALQFFYDSTPESRAQIQAALYNRGLLPKKWRSFGEADETSFSAWRKALIRSARSGKPTTIWEVLSGKPVTMTQFFDKEGEGGNQLRLAASSLSGAARGGGRSRAALQLRYSNASDLKAHARLAAQETLGYVPQDDFLDDFVKLYHGLEAGSQRRAYAGKSSTDPGSPQVKAAELAKKEHKVEAEGYAIVKQFDNLMQVLGVEQ